MVISRHNATAQDVLALLNLHRLPARLNCAETAALLGFQEHDIAVLIASKCLAPLGRPVQNAPKYFAAVEIVALAQDRDWLDRATRALAKHWISKNQRGFSQRAKNDPSNQT